jgi:hypothetical protein
MRRERGGQRRSNRGGGGRSSRGRGQRHGRRHPRQSAESGNQRERIAVESGDLVLIDQFMLANPQFIEKISAALDESAEVKSDLIKEYGGTVINVTCGTYRIERDPFAYTIIVHPEDESLEAAPEIVKEATENVGEINVDTRCLAMLDRELLDDRSSAISSCGSAVKTKPVETSCVTTAEQCATAFVGMAMSWGSFRYQEKT